MNIILIRHGETEANIKSDAKPVLTPKGRKQIIKLANSLKDSNIDIIISSNQERASLTAKEIQKVNKKLKLIETEELQEIYQLIIGGAVKKGTRPNRFEEDLERAESFWKRMLKWKYKKVAIVCHGNIIRFFLSKAAGAPSDRFYGIKIDPASVSVINVDKNKTKIISVNDIAHIPKELLSNNLMCAQSFVTKNFNLARTLECGQFFRYKKIGNWYYVQSRNRVFKVKQEGNKLFIDGDVCCSFAKRFFGLRENYGKIIKSISKDAFIKKAIAQNKGLRIIQQDPWECLVSFICATAANIPKIQLNIEHLARHFGKPVVFDGMTFYSFPEPGTLCSEAKVRKCKSGFRTKYIMHANKCVNENWLKGLKRLPYATAKQKLVQLKGVGEKVADCVLLYSLGKSEAFPVDVWIKRVVQKLYFKNKNGSNKQIREFANEHFGKHAGWAQQFLYAWARNEKH